VIRQDDHASIGGPPSVRGGEPDHAGDANRVNRYRDLEFPKRAAERCDGGSILLTGAGGYSSPDSSACTASGPGDYTRDRDQWQKDLTLDQVIESIRAQRKQR
jgi:hypothetical protein